MKVRRVGNALTRRKGVGVFRSALLRREGVRGFGFGIGYSGVIQMTRDGRRQVGIGCIGVGTVTVVTHRLVDVVLVAQVINVAVGVKKEKLSCDEVWWLLMQQKRAVVVLALTQMDTCIDADHGVVISTVGERVSKNITYMMSGWTQTTGNADAGECGSCYGCVWMGTVVVISAVDDRISKKINLHNRHQEIDESLLNLYIPLSFFPCTPTYIIMIYHQIMSVTPWECLE